MIMTHKTKGKFQPKWEGPFVIETVYSNRAYRLMISDGDADQWQVSKEILSLIKDPSHDQVNTTPLIKTFKFKVHIKSSLSSS